MENFDILFVDDDREILDLVEKYLSRFGYNIHVVDNAMEAMDMVSAGNYGIVFTDYKMPEVDGLELLSTIKEYKPETVVVVVTGHGTMESAIDAMRFGSYDFIQKPFKLDVLKIIIDRVYEEKKLAKENFLLRSRLTPRHRYASLIGLNLKMQEIYEIIDRMKADSPDVLIQGEVGTGKELTARVIHETGARSKAPFVTVKCESFSNGSSGSKSLDKLIGLLESAAGGTLFMDEIGACSPDLQKTLFRMLQTRAISHAGKEGTVAVETRIIASTRGDLDDAISAGKMDPDLLHHLKAVHIKMPALRQRKEDICPLIISFLDRVNRTKPKKIGGISTRAMDVMLAYHWPGNIIELENVIERAYAMDVETTIRYQDLPSDIKAFGKISRIK